MPPPTLPEILAILARRGERLTRTRRAVVEALAAAGGPVSVRALHHAVGEARVDLVTVYRTLHWLRGLGVAREVLTGGAAELYELCAPGGHAHHLHCDRCGAVLTIPGRAVDGDVEERIRREHGFVVTHHRLTFHGVCRACSGAAPGDQAN